MSTAQKRMSRRIAAIPAGLRQDGWGVGVGIGFATLRAALEVPLGLGGRFGVNAERALVLLDRDCEVVVAPRKLDMGLASLDRIGGNARRTLLFGATQEIYSVRVHTLSPGRRG